jgi:hypothetical protein
VLGVREVREVVGPVREVEREVLVAVSPDVADDSGALDDEVGDAESSQAGSKCEAAGRVNAVIDRAKVRTHF